MRIFNPRNSLSINRRKLLGYTAATGLAASSLGRFGALAQMPSVDTSQWSPDYIRSIAGTIDVDTAAECAKVVPLNYEGHVTLWYVGANEASDPITREMERQFFDAFAKTYPNITIDKLNLNYNDISTKLRTAALGRAAPMVARLMLLWGGEYAAKGQLMELAPEDVGHASSDFWPGALKSCRWQGKTYGVPCRNETMALIWNAAIFDQAGLPPESPPATWADVVEYSKQIKEKTGKAGYGLVARVNAGNTPYRFMPKAWAYGGGALDETDPNPDYKEVYLNNEGTQAALQVCYDMYVRDRSVPVSALTNTNDENLDPFTANNLAMMISHPSSYTALIDRASRAVGEDRKIAEGVVENTRYGLIPEGPERRAVVFGGWNAHMFHPDYVDGEVDVDAARALITFMTGPEWSIKLGWSESNPGNLRGFRTKWMKERLDTIRFLDVTTSMLPDGIPFPVIPESTEIMNIIVPEMLQNALTEKMSVAEACDQAARQVEELISGI